MSNICASNRSNDFQHENDVLPTQRESRFIWRPEDAADDAMPTPQTAQGVRVAGDGRVAGRVAGRAPLEWHSDGSESVSSIASAPSTPRTVIHADPSFVVYTYEVPLPRVEPPPRPGSMAVRKRVSQADAHLRAGVRQAKADACYGQAQALKSSKTYADVSTSTVRAPEPCPSHLQLG